MLRLKNYFIMAVSISVTVGCGSSKSSKDSTSVRGTATVSYPQTGKLAECNRINMNNAQIEGQLGQFYDPSTRNRIPNYIALNFTVLPIEILNGTYQLQFFRWSLLSGNKQINQIPIRIFYLDKLTGASTTNQMVDKISKTSMDTARNFFGASWINVPETDFFKRTMVILTGLDMQYEGLSIAVYNPNTGTAAIAQIDTLLPPFDSNPVNYKTARPYPAIYSLHPNYSFLNSNATDSDYYQMIDDICRDLSGVGTRIPASTKPEENSPSFFSTVWTKIKIFLNHIL